MNPEELDRTWRIRNEIKIYPIRLEIPTKHYKIGITTNTAPEKIGKQIYPVEPTKQQ
ncbi:MAG: hypothetical protein HRT69_16960 [Flavobacteriaceae bacterium]|nr:hypothetical protein [Flavobacteriaceae bacterium]